MSRVCKSPPLYNGYEVEVVNKRAFFNEQGAYHSNIKVVTVMPACDNTNNTFDTVQSSHGKPFADRGLAVLSSRATHLLHDCFVLRYGCEGVFTGSVRARNRLSLHLLSRLDTLADCLQSDISTAPVKSGSECCTETAFAEDANDVEVLSRESLGEWLRLSKGSKAGLLDREAFDIEGGLEGSESRKDGCSV